MVPKGKKKAAAVNTKALNNFGRLLLAFGNGNGGGTGGVGGGGGKGGDGRKQIPDGGGGKRKRDPVWGDWCCKNCSVKDPSFFVFKKNDNCPKCDGHKGDHFKGWALKKDAAATNHSQSNSSDSDLAEENKKLKEELKSVREAAGAKGVEMPQPVVPEGPLPKDYDKCIATLTEVFGAEDPRVMALREEKDVKERERKAARPPSE